MAQLITIPAEERTETGKGAANRVRREGNVPAVMYGPKIGNRNLYVSANTIEKLLASGAGGQLIDVAIGGGKAHRVDQGSTARSGAGRFAPR